MEKKELAFDFLNMITGSEVMTRVSEKGGDPRYLLSARYSAYDALSAKYPIYEKLKEIVSIEDAYVFRIRPDGVAYMKEAKKNADLLPPLVK